MLHVLGASGVAAVALKAFEKLLWGRRRGSL